MNRKLSRIILSVFATFSFASCSSKGTPTQPSNTDQSFNGGGASQTPGGGEQTPSGGEQTPSGGGTGQQVTSVAQAVAAYHKSMEATNKTVHLAINDHEQFDEDVIEEGYLRETETEELILEKNGNQTKATSSYKSFFEIDIEKYAKSHNQTIDEVLSVFYEDKLEELADSYFRLGRDNYDKTDVNIDLEHGTISSASDYTSVFYTIYDEQAKQTYAFTEPHQIVHWNHATYSDYLESASKWIADDSYELLNIFESYMGYLSGASCVNNKISFTIDKDVTGEATVIVESGYLKKASFVVNNTKGLSYEGFIEFSKINETNPSIPSYHRTPHCTFSHDEHTPTRYFTDKQSHRLCCQKCHKFLDSEPHAHVYNSNNYHVCDICGDIANDYFNYRSSTPEGFWRDEEKGDYFMAGSITSYGVGDYWLNGNFYGYGFDNKSYYVFEDDNVIITVTSQSTKLENTCLREDVRFYEIYRDVPADIITQRYSENFYNYVESKAASASCEAHSFYDEHNYGEYVTFEKDACHTYHESKCSDCGLTHIAVDHHHTSETAWDYTPINPCLEYGVGSCPDCGEITEEYITYTDTHSEGGVSQSIPLDSCHTLIADFCPVCGEATSGYRISEDHKNVTEKEIVINDCVTKTITICNDCHLILDTKIDEHHGDVKNVWCPFDEFNYSEFVENFGYPYFGGKRFENSALYYSYCEDCGSLVGEGLIELDMDRLYITHAYKSDYSDYMIGWSLMNGRTIYYVDHIFDENGVCELCGGREIDLGNEPIGMCYKFNENGIISCFYNKDTRERFDFGMYTGMDDQEIDGIQYHLLIFTSDELPGFRYTIYQTQGEDGVWSGVKSLIEYDNFTKSIEISDAGIVFK